MIYIINSVNNTAKKYKRFYKHYIFDLSNIKMSILHFYKDL